MAPRFRISRVFLAVMLSVASLLNSAEAALFLSRGNRSSLGDAVDDYQAGCRNVVRQLESSSKAEQLASCIGYGLAEVSCRTEQQYLGLAHWTAGSVAEVCVHLSSELVMLERAGSPRNVSFAQSMESTLQGKTDDYDGQPQEPLPPYNQSDPNPFINEDANTLYDCRDDDDVNATEQHNACRACDNVYHGNNRNYDSAMAAGYHNAYGAFDNVYHWNNRNYDSVYHSVYHRNSGNYSSAMAAE
eukprot:CAMPEP_0170616160 /NCGR_PEP_ID=MMETSP0224-20130122/25726_1 /TAXON_ID=285029 /ORGANISM="Togula jolla, Strain CCCM 725" /LENGTH=243 /DNA_ID=CAMNT_0010941947 /DNA_START=54 /DNA_END=784 /DNA_ORIENTATION=+